MRRDTPRLVVFVPGNGRAPRRFGNQHQPVQMGNNADLVALDLVVAPVFVFEAGGGEALFQFRLGLGGTGAACPLLKFSFVILKVVVDAIQFAPQIIGLARPDTVEIGRQLLAQRVGYPLLPSGKVQRGPRNSFFRAGVDFREIQLFSQGLVAPAVGEIERQAMQRPLLIDRLNFTARQEEQGKMPGGLERPFKLPARTAWKLSVPESFGGVGGRSLSRLESLESHPLDRQGAAA